MRYLYLIRHAQTEFLQSDARSNMPNDSRLSVLGTQEAEQLAVQLASHQFDLLASSVMRRAKETASYFAKNRDLHRIETPALNEYFLDSDGNQVEDSEIALVRILGFLLPLRPIFDSIALVSHRSILATVVQTLLNKPFQESKALFERAPSCVLLRYDWRAGEKCWSVAETFEAS